MKRPLPTPVQGTTLTDKDGKPTSHNYRWMDSVNTSINDTQDDITTKFENATGDAPLYYCRAWVNFDGTKDTTGASSTSNTDRLIRGSGNVASVTRNGAGLYTINFTTAMPDANYSVLGFSSNNDDNANESYVVSRQNSGTYTTTACQITNTENTTTNTTRFDSGLINVLIFR